MNKTMRKGIALLLAACCVCTAVPAEAKADVVSVTTNTTPTGSYSSYTRAEVLKSDTMAYDTLSSSNNVHYYKYTADKTGYFTINLAQLSGKGVWNVSVYDADHSNQELEGQALAENFTSRSYNLAAGRSVYIKVERVRDVDVKLFKYDITKDYMYSIIVRTTTATDWEQEDNDTKLTATVLPQEMWINGSSYKTSDVDWYTYTIPQRGYFTFNFRDQNSTAARWTVTLYDDNLKELEKETVAQTLTSGKYVFPAGTKVYIKVAGYKAGNQYQIQADYTASNVWELESNDTMENATKLTAGKEMHGSVQNKSDVDYYRYVAKGTGYFKILFTNVDGGENQYWKLSLYDEKKNLLQTVETEEELQTTLAAMSFRKGKEIYLKVERNINDYACGHEYTVLVKQSNASGWEQESNNSFKTATVLKKNKTCKANNYSVRDKDYFVYQAAKRGNASIKVTLPEEGYWSVTVYNQKKKAIQKEDYVQNGKKITCNLKKGENVYVLVKARTQSAMGRTYKVTVK